MLLFVSWTLTGPVSPFPVDIYHFRCNLNFLLAGNRNLNRFDICQFSPVGQEPCSKVWQMGSWSQFQFRCVCVYTSLACQLGSVDRSYDFLSTYEQCGETAIHSCFKILREAFNMTIASKLYLKY